MNLGRNVNTHPLFSIHKRSRGSTPQGFFFSSRMSLSRPHPTLYFQRSSHSLSYSKSLRRKEPLQLILVYPDYSFTSPECWFIGYFFGKGNRKLGGSGTPPFPPRHLGRRCWPRPALGGAGSLLSGSESP